MTQRTALSAAAVVLSLGLLTGLGAPAAADTFQVDPVHSGVFFRIKHLNVGYGYGRFNDLAGQIVLDDQNPAANSVQLTIKTDSVDTGNAKRDAHLKGPDFFNSKEFPAITFQSKQVKAIDPKTLEVIGELNLHGVSKPLTVKLQRVGSGNDPWGNTRAGFEANVTLRRADFGMNFMPQALGDEVWLLIGLEAVKK